MCLLFDCLWLDKLSIVTLIVNDSHYRTMQYYA
nr:MAG TPA: hypothetical protein [Caudoviricetes sp.]